MLNFKEPYNKDSALIFLGKFLPEDFKSFDEDVKTSFKTQFIHNIRKIGEVGSLENLHIYEITHESENDPRVSLSKDSFRLLAHFGVRKALIFFVSKKSPNYRLSLVTVDLKWEKGTRIEKEYSNPRRYSFFLGPDARVHTPNDFLIKKQRVNNIEDLISRFDVELVTKEFFEKYRSLYENIKGYLYKDNAFKNFSSRSDVDIDTFAKKLLGQIVFCYFLQRKGWLGASKSEPVNNGDKDFMRALFTRSIQEKKDFFNDCLEYLFYDCLNRKADDGDYYREHFKCQIPFLNGGLFEPPQDYSWQKDFIHIPARIFSNKDGSGVLDVFDLYNFTVYEDDPVDREVSVDPEMLGKVFENLLPENTRKGQGAYYTPREIVHYMCQESLINYLSTDTKISTDRVKELVQFKDMALEDTKKDSHSLKNETSSLLAALKNIKICDPACGSGAFLVGMLHEITRLKRYLDTEKNESEYRIKKETIQNCIYGVDIDPGAVEIAKLRLWLSLVVDYELKDIEPLPNLDYKIMCGNSLIEELIIGEEAIKLFDEKLFTVNKKQNDDIDENEKIKELKKRRDEIQKEMIDLHNKNILTQSKKRDLDQKLSEINREISPKTRKRKPSEYHATLFVEKAEHYFKLLKELHAKYFVEYDTVKKKEKQKQIETIELEFVKSSIQERVEEVDGKIKNLNAHDPAEQKTHASLMKQKLEYLKIPNEISRSKVRPYFLWKLNFFEVFQEKGGFDVVIANPPYVKKEHLEQHVINQLDRVFKDTSGKNWSDDLYVHFIFKAVELSRYSGIVSFITNDSFVGLASKIRVRNLLLHYDLKNLIKCPRETFEAMIYTNVFLLKKSESVRKSYESGYFTYPGFSYCNLGLVSYDTIHYLPNFRLVFFSPILKVYSKFVNIPRVKDYLDIHDTGIHSGNVRGKIFFKDKVSSNLKKLVQGKQIMKYGISWDTSGAKFKYCDINYIPKKCKGIGRKGKPSRHEEYWHFCGDIENHHQPERLLMRQSDDDLIVAYHSEKELGRFYTDNTLFTIFSKKEKDVSLKYAMALLNSSLMNALYHFLSQEEGKTLAQVKVGLVNELPFIVKEQKKIIDLVEKISEITKSIDYFENELKQKRVQEYEYAIDKVIYEIYSLTKEDANIIKNGSPVY